MNNAKSERKSNQGRILAGCLLVFLALLALGIVITLFGGGSNKGNIRSDDKATKVAAFLQDYINRPENSGGKVTCEARRIDENLVQCDLRYVSGMTNLGIIANTKGIAEMSGEVGIASTVYFTGWRGNLKVCEYKWDIYSRTVTPVK